MKNSDKIKDGLEKAYKRLIEFKKYKKSPIIVSKNGEVIEIAPEKITTHNKVYK
ncbi:hypothetical protein MHTCC0001_29520 [Flavobacteriaceae bacterium MHTCC 0001]